VPAYVREKPHYRVATFKPAAGVPIGLAALMMGLGVLAVVVPSAVGFRLAILFGSLSVVSGLTHVTYALAAESAATFLCGAVIGAVYVIAGVYLAVNPTLELAPLTLVLSSIFLAEGILDFGLFLKLRSRPRSAWMLFNSITALILGSVSWRSWPADSTWQVGMIAGVNLLVSGFSRLMHSTFTRRSLRLV